MITALNAYIAVSFMLFAGLYVLARWALVPQTFRRFLLLACSCCYSFFYAGKPAHGCWELGNMGIWGYGNMGMWKYGYMEQEYLEYGLNLFGKSFHLNTLGINYSTKTLYPYSHISLFPYTFQAKSISLHKYTSCIAFNIFMPSANGF